MLISAATFDEFVADLKEAEEQNECRYAVFDAEFNLNDGQKRTKLVFFLWLVFTQPFLHSPRTVAL